MGQKYRALFIDEWPISQCEVPDLTQMDSDTYIWFALQPEPPKFMSKINNANVFSISEICKKNCF